MEGLEELEQLLKLSNGNQYTHDPVQFVHFKTLDNLISLFKKTKKKKTIIKSKVTQGEKLCAHEGTF